MKRITTFPWAPLGLLALFTAATSGMACSKSSSPSVAAQPDAGPSTDASVSTDVDAGNPFQAVHDELFGGTWVTDGVVIQYKGQIVYEEYANGYTASNAHLTYSASKSVGSALIGIAIGDGLMKKSDSICTYITQPAGADPTLCNTTIEHLLWMSSGLTWAEDYGVDPTTSNVLQMLYGDVSDMGSYAASLPRAAPTSTVWNYSSGTANLLALAFKGALKGQDPRAYAKTKLFDPLGMSSAVMEEDRAGTPVFSSWIFLTPRDMAKFGQLYLDAGMVGATQVLPVGWATYSATPAPTRTTPTDYDASVSDSGGSYGAQWWLNSTSPTAETATFEFPDAPPDEYAAEGHYGQMISVIPSRSLVIVRTGNDRETEYNADVTIQKAVAVIDAMTAKGNGQ